MSRQTKRSSEQEEISRSDEINARMKIVEEVAKSPARRTQQKEKQRIQKQNDISNVVNISKSAEKQYEAIGRPELYQTIATGLAKTKANLL